MKTIASTTIPSTAELEEALGPALILWRQLLAELGRDFPGLRQEWKPSKNRFGAYSLLKHGERVLLYLLPAPLTLEVAVILGERAVAVAGADELLKARRKLIAQAPRCAAGRTIRFSLEAAADIAAARRLVHIKTAPR